MIGRAEIVLEMENPEMVYRAIAPEMEDELHRGAVRLEVGEGRLGLEVRGDDVGSIRAALNTWIRLIKIGWEMFNI